jgi:hypothetical protein
MLVTMGWAAEYRFDGIVAGVSSRKCTVFVNGELHYAGEIHGDSARDNLIPP